jgi:hypothetical protein
MTYMDILESTIRAEMSRNIAHDDKTINSSVG